MVIAALPVFDFAVHGTCAEPGVQAFTAGWADRGVGVAGGSRRNPTESYRPSRVPWFDAQRQPRAAKTTVVAPLPLRKPHHPPVNR